MAVKWNLAMLLLASSCCDTVVRAVTRHEVLFDEGISERYPASNPLMVNRGDTVDLTCGVNATIYRHSMLFEFETCMTVVPSETKRAVLCAPGAYMHPVIILDTPSATIRYTPGDYYYAAYSDLNRTHPSGLPCSDGFKMALRVEGDTTEQVDGTAVDGTTVDGTAGTDGLSSGDGPLLDTTQIIIVAVAASIGSLVACGVLLLIILLCVLAKRGRKGNMSTKPDVESDRSKGKHPEPKEQEKKKNSSIPKTEGKTDLTERSSVDGATKSNGKEVPKRKTKKTEPSLPSKTETDKGLPNKGTPNIVNGKRNIGKGTQNISNGSSTTAASMTAPKTGSTTAPKTAVSTTEPKTAGKVSTNTVVSFTKNSNEVNIEDSGSRRNQRSGSKSQPPNGANRKLPPVQAADKNKAVGNKLATRDSRPNVDPIDTDRAGLRKKTNSGPSRSLPTDPRGGVERTGGTRGTNPGGLSGRQGSVAAKATRPAPRPPPGANRPPVPKAPGKEPVSQSLTTTTRKNSSNVQRPTNSLTTHS